jgi:hypothetical protein
MIRDRIKELRRVPASSLVRNPKNWRTHPHAQAQALQGILEEVGYADALLVRETDDGSLMLIDGHLRADSSDDMEVPVLILDVDEAEADKLLATFDPISAMAEGDGVKLDELAEQLDFDSASLRKLVDDLIGELPIDDDDEVVTNKWTEINATNVEEMELQPEEHYDYVLVLADNVNDWNRLVTLLDLPDAKLSRTHRRLGIARATTARRILELIDEKEG